METHHRGCFISDSDMRTLTAKISALKERTKGANERFVRAALDDVRAGDFTFTGALAARRQAEDDLVRIEAAKTALDMKDWEPPPAGR